MRANGCSTKTAPSNAVNLLANESKGATHFGNGWPGYCPHGESLFLTWHPCYVLLYEQILVEHAKRLANLYPTMYRKQYVNAANSL
ncbi:hypothetical protein ACHAPA_006642 [Fusarium lateritium]